MTNDIKQIMHGSQASTFRINSKNKFPENGRASQDISIMGDKRWKDIIRRAWMLTENLAVK